VKRARQRPARGAAIVTAMILVALVVTLSAAMVWQQWRAVSVETAERARTQAGWILVGALDWARLILREDARSGRPTALTEPWAQPLPETRLASFLADDKSRVEDAPEAFLSGAIQDAQARYNLLNLVDGEGKPVAVEVATLQRLCDLAGLPGGSAERIAAGMAAALAPVVAEGNRTAPLLPRAIDQLRWFGLDAAGVARLAPSVVLLPVRTPVNLNTAPREVIAAVIPGLDLATAERIVRERQSAPLRNLDAARRLLSGTVQLDARRVSTVSAFFEVRGRLRLDDSIVEEQALMQRRGLEVRTVWRDRVGLVEAPR
jgi:general secretion pathway protein K